MTHPATAIRTASGRLVDLADFRAEDVLLSDIAYALAHITRYTGHCPLQPTVAQHSLAVEHIARELFNRKMAGKMDHDNWGTPNVLLKAALMHDAQEAYVSDLSAPAKNALRHWADVPHSDFDLMENDVSGAVKLAFGLLNTTDIRRLVHRADVLAWTYESAWRGWSSEAADALPGWLMRDLYVACCYGLVSFASPKSNPETDGGEAVFLRRAAALGIRDAH